MIETKRLILRPFSKSDFNDLYEYLKNPTVNCFKSMQTKTIIDAQKAVAERINEELYFAIMLKSNNKVIGEIFAYPDGERDKENCDTYSPCWMLNKDYLGQGFGYESAKAFFDYLFKEKNARRLYAYTEDYNIASQKLCEKLGMRREGFFKEFISK